MGDRSKLLVYLDHNILDSMIKGDRFQVKEFFSDPAKVPVFSDENLKEISRSTGGEEKFLKILREIKARHIKSILDAQFMPTGKAEIRDVDPAQALASHLDTIRPFQGVDAGMRGMLQKYYGGLGDRTFADVLDGGTQTLWELLESSLNTLEAEGEQDPHLLSQLKQLIDDFPRAMSTLQEQISSTLDSSGSTSQVNAFEAATGLGPIVFNNVRPPNVVQQIWNMIRATSAFSTLELDLETFFRIKGTPWHSAPEREPTLAEKVNGIYHQLNFLGYHRDTKMKSERRFNASFSDMTHAGMASFCHVFVSRDEGLVMKAAAAYEYLTVGTSIVFLKERE